jgi:hypothetical protein
MSAYFAMIAAWKGEKDLAIEQLSAVIQNPKGFCGEGSAMAARADPTR